MELYDLLPIVLHGDVLLRQQFQAYHSGMTKLFHIVQDKQMDQHLQCPNFYIQYLLCNNFSFPNLQLHFLVYIELDQMVLDLILFFF